jgi:asparagine synthase (glutamine-hydrolysing)
MCGYVGIYSDKLPSNEKFLESLTKIYHRGPDNQGIQTLQNLILGHSRLSIIDLNKNANQPIFSACGRFLLIHNGEIYNFETIKKELINLGLTFQTNSDSEVILQSYNQWGEKCLQKFDGMFSFVIYDKDQNKLFGARDRIGVKPLYYHLDNESFIFSTTINSILTLKPELKNKTCENAIRAYFEIGFLPGEISSYQDIKKILPGHSFNFDLETKKLEISKYWDFKTSTPYKGKYNQATNELHNILRRSVKSRFVSDVPVGIFLSGGIDSSLVQPQTSGRHHRILRTFAHLGRKDVAASPCPFHHNRRGNRP